MKEYRFKIFNFQGLIDFVRELYVRYNMLYIVFSPERKEYFSDIQLTHISPDWTITHPNGFVWAWMKKEKEVRKISFDLFSKDHSREITMSIDLDRKIVSLNKNKGVSVIEIEEVLSKKLLNIDNNTAAKKEIKFNIPLSVIKNNILKIVLVIIVILILYFFLDLRPNKFNLWGFEYEIPFPQNKNNPITNTIDRSIFEIVSEYNNKPFSNELDKQTSFNRFTLMTTRNEVGKIEYIEKESNNSNVSVLISSLDNDEGAPAVIRCLF